MKYNNILSINFSVTLLLVILLSLNNFIIRYQHKPISSEKSIFEVYLKNKQMAIVPFFGLNNDIEHVCFIDKWNYAHHMNYEKYFFYLNVSEEALPQYMVMQNLLKVSEEII